MYDELELNEKIIEASNLTGFEFEDINDNMVVDKTIYRVDTDIANSEYGLNHHWYNDDIDKARIESNLTILRKAQSNGYKFVKLTDDDYEPLTDFELERVSDYVDYYVDNFD